MNLSGKRILVLGLGISGLSAAEYCVAHGATVVVADERDRDALGSLATLPAEVEIHVGTPFPDPSDFDITVPSPGIPPARYAERARCIWGDIEIAARALSVPFVAVTGTNGKTTTVRLIEAMLNAAGLRAAAAGNVGTPALSLPGMPLDAAVMEVSSFQLEAVDAFRPNVSVVLNLSPDHLDRHGDLAGYAAAKRRILAQQRKGDTAVLNFDDPLVRGFADGCAADVLPFSTRADPALLGFERAVWLDAGAIVLRGPNETQRIAIDSESAAAGHHPENIVAALSAVWALGADVERAATALIEFSGLRHRCEVIAEIDGVTYVNDSKATNPGAADSALRGFDQPIHWIAGGRDKGLTFDVVAETASRRVRRAYLIGEAAPLIEAALADRVPCERNVSLDQAVERAAHSSERGDVVLLAPACASFDQFKSFEERGDRFRLAVQALAQEQCG